MTTAIIIQARLGSTRLPGKVLKHVCGKSLLAHLIERLRSRPVADIVVATTDASSDLAIVDECQRLGVRVTRGSEHDVLDRYLQTAREVSANTIVRITSDCPLLDPELVEGMVTRFAEGDLDYLSNGLRPGLPAGQSVEVMSREALEQAMLEGNMPYHREHVTPYLYEEIGRFAIKHITWPESIQRNWPEDLSHHRWTVDSPEDFELVRRIFEAGYSPGARFGIREILDVLELNPSWPAINASVVQKHYTESAWPQ